MPDQAAKRGGIFWIDKQSVIVYADEMKRLGAAKNNPWRAGARQRAT
ncbi:MAG: hypothetical protein KJ734_04115 [Chloroflexi bacterium]|nr:hypothetical protein [Chloroflexota bacterium]